MYSRQTNNTYCMQVLAIGSASLGQSKHSNAASCCAVTSLFPHNADIVNKTLRDASFSPQKNTYMHISTMHTS